ncbi:abasic site processing protein HMCES isoform X2 [Cryptotermes secundus]|uniref:abasic site processing protein HMCES isoform X2 n=1 Tax=Cryptotermes secundus TaxID=105785 RepID=UPI000CD7B1CA|nr:abasic site processing protein HMCES isoform X2 [Cryptotermes secundus]
MCGRTACSLCAEDVQKACSFRGKNSDKYQLPNWANNIKNRQQYRPSYNVAPTDVTPVLVSGSHFSGESERMLQPMMWGMVPSWHKGDYRSHGLSTNNCRLEGLLSSKLYSRPFSKGQRCVVVCDGFYEWQTTKGNRSKQPYFIYMPQDEGVCIEDPATWSCDWSEVGGWRGPKLLYMAGLFDVWTSSEGEEIYSYSVITLDSDNTLAWLHHRMPAILEGEQIQDWLDIERVSSRAALAMIRPMKLLTWHPVSTLVNNSRNKEPQCNKPITLEKPKPASQSQVFMESWLKKGTVKHELDKLENESAMSPDDSRDESHLVMKKIKKEETSSTT